MRLRAKKPVSRSYPKELKTVGDHIRKRRLDLGILQRQVAAILSVDVMSVVGWEVGGREPLVRQIPRIIEFLGYIPEDLFPVRSIGEKIRRYRMLHGMTRKQLAKRMKIDEATLARIEEGKGRFLAEVSKKITRLLSSLERHDRD